MRTTDSHKSARVRLPMSEGGEPYFNNNYMSYKRKSKSKAQSRMDNPEKLATLGTHDEKTKQHNTIPKQAQIT